MSVTINIRFYEELNDFLANRRKKKAFEHTFSGRPDIKDIVESLGVPHGEIDLILANGNSVDFKYKPGEGDVISVYPQFESIDIAKVVRLRPEPLRITRFILDVHLGKLCKYMRMLGFDCYYNKKLNDEEIISMALAEHRIILTRDIPLLKHGSVMHGYWVRNEDPLKQLNEVIMRFDLQHNLKPFQRCMECNGELTHVHKQDIIELLNPGTIKHFDEFFQCGQCKRVYWKGSHYDNMLKMVEGLRVES